MMDDFSQIAITELAAIIAEHLHLHGIHVVLVGGLAVEIYTHNLYLTHDIDMVNTSHHHPKHIAHAMAALDFHKSGRVFVHASTPICVEFPPAPLSVGDELIHHTTTVNVAGRQIPILCVEDVVKDRLAAFMHWRDNQSLIQAVAMMLKHALIPTQFQAFCLREGTDSHFRLLEQLLHTAQQQQLTTMAELEYCLTALLLHRL